MKKIQKYLPILRYIVPTVYFNFHYLPFLQAIHLPIFLYKPHLLKCKGMIQIKSEDGHLYPGMIRLGFRQVSIYPNNGITWEQKGGIVVFRGRCMIGNDSYLSIGKSALLDIGEGFMASAAIKLACHHSITFHPYVRFGWDCICMDTNFHPLYDMEKKEFKPASGPIEIGDHNWFGMGCRVMHSVVTPEHCIWGMGTTVTRGCVKKSYCVMGDSPVRILSENVVRIIGHNVE